MIRLGSFVVFGVALLSAGVARAQGTRASISGLVQDPTGASIPNAESDTPRRAGGLMGWTASKAVGYWFRRRAQARL